MIKVKIKCDKHYGEHKGWIDANFVDNNILSQIIEKYTVDNILEITEEVVDFYNQQTTSKHNRKSHKTANAIANQLRKLIKILEADTHTYYI